MSDIVWTNQVRKLKDLIPWEINPRQIKVKNAGILATSFNDFGQVELIVIGPNNELYNGHQRLSVLLKEHGPEYEVEVRVASRPLTELERAKLTVYLHQGAVGEWDFDVMANNDRVFDVDLLLDWGFEKFDLGLASYYTTNTAPEIGAVVVTDGDITATEAELNGRFKDGPDMVQVICPHCATEFYIRRSDAIKSR